MRTKEIAVFIDPKFSKEDLVRKVSVKSSGNFCNNPEILINELCDSDIIINCARATLAGNIESSFFITEVTLKVNQKQMNPKFV